METTTTKPFFGRKAERRAIVDFLSAPKSGFLHVRGRRRIGKSELLKKIRDEYPRCFYFSGRDDEADRACRRRFVREWDAFLGREDLGAFAAVKLTWDFIFAHLAKESLVKKGKLVLMLDEIQWIASGRNGFVGLLKSFWEDYKNKGQLKIIISGSSSNFFHQYVDGELAVLRGTRTQASLWVPPFDLTEIKTYYGPGWTHQEVILVAMITGGIPYYLDTLEGDNAMRAINKAFFTSGTIFLEEIDSILKVETAMASSRTNVKKVLSHLGITGGTESGVVKRTGMSQALVHIILGRLVDWGLVKLRLPLGKVKENQAGAKYYIDDLFMNFYFQVLEPIAAKIRANDRGGMLFTTEVLKSEHGLYIPNFSGEALELLVTKILDRGKDNLMARRERMFNLLGVESVSFNVGTYWLPGETQIDIVVNSVDDRETRVIECKWLGRKAASADLLDQVEGKIYPGLKQTGRRSHFLLLPGGATSSLLSKARSRRVGIIGIDDLFRDSC